VQLGPAEDAIRAWVKAALPSFTDAQIYFGNQQIAQPAALPFVTITLAIDGTTKGLPEIDRATNLSLPAGTEVQQTGVTIWDLSLSFQAFAENTVTYPVITLPAVLPGTNGITAVELLGRIQIALDLESVHNALNAAGIAPYEYGTVKRADAVIEDHWEGRALLEMKFYLSDTIVEGVGYVAEVTGTGILHGDTPDPITIPFQAGP
jgi:hypothetical protein